MVTPKK